MKKINGVKCRTATESLKYIIKRAGANKIGPTKSDLTKNPTWSNCMYEYPSGNNCAVGCLFSKEQLKYINKYNSNNISIDALSNVIGVKNIETVTGLKLQDLISLQEIHDEAVDEYQDYNHNRISTAVIEESQKLLNKYKGIK